jgi:hypothetical protein
MNKRPKSREETPKEGSDNASVIAPQQYATALHKTQGFLNHFPVPKSQVRSEGKRPKVG